MRCRRLARTDCGSTAVALPHAAPVQERTKLFGTYNTVATLAGSLGALIALAASSPRWLLVYPLAACAGLLASARLSPQSS